ncbi:MAG: hypothetical protein IBJ12_11170 [Sphingomonadaceae bacterium]|nr:hypothetical protein [Sphingomonadaceae bacterium]
MTLLPKDPKVTERNSVILTEAERRNLRRKLKNSFELAQDVLNPRNRMKRFVSRNKAEAKRVADSTSQIAKKNAPLIGAIGLGALLFAARRPISNWISNLRTTKTQMPHGDEDRNQI